MSKHQRFTDEDDSAVEIQKTSGQPKPFEQDSFDTLPGENEDVWEMLQTSWTNSDVKRAEEQHTSLVKAYFRLLDEDDSGQLELNEVENGLEMMGVESIGACNFMKAGDKDGDEKLTLDEFVGLCSKASDHGMGNCIVYPYLSSCADVSSTRHLNANGLVRFHHYLDWKNEKHMTIMNELWNNFTPNPDELALFSSMTVQHPEVFPLIKAELDKISDEELQPYFPLLVRSAPVGSPLLKYFVGRCGGSIALSSYLTWFLGFNPERYADELEQLKSIQRDCPEHMLLEAQTNVVCKLRDLVPILRRTPIKSRQELFQSRLKDKDLQAEFISPLYATCKERIDGSKSLVFNSYNAPILLGFHESEDSSGSRVLYKMGQDIRADQMVVEVAQLIDDDLRKNGMDLKLNPFKIMATSAIDGWVEIVDDSTPIAKIRKSEYKGDIMAWLLDKNKDNPACTESKLRHNFVRTCAGWTIVTYLLGIGDRHMDNIMITSKGELFHIDFDFVFGEDPKPFAPKVKLAPEMQAMMGEFWESYFPDLVVSAFLIVRKHHASIMNKLVQDSQLGIEGFSGEPAKQHIKFVYERFHLFMDDKRAYAYLKNMMQVSASSKWARFFDWMHDLKQIYGDCFAWLIVLVIFAALCGIIGGIVLLILVGTHVVRFTNNLVT